jgi:hypothetical protein
MRTTCFHYVPRGVIARVPVSLVTTAQFAKTHCIHLRSTCEGAFPVMFSPRLFVAAACPGFFRASLYERDSTNSAICCYKPSQTEAIYQTLKLLARWIELPPSHVMTCHTAYPACSVGGLYAVL